MSNKVNIIGAGIGGLTAACYLSSGGFNVEVFEKNDKPGGKVNETYLGDFRFDMGPSLITMPFVFENLFKFCGENINQHIQFERLDVICKYFWEDGTELNASTNMKQMQNEISKLSVQDAEKYPDFLKYSKKIYDFSKDLFLFEPFQENEILLRLNNLSKLFNIKNLDAFRTVNDAVSNFFESEKTRQIFNRYATYNGSNPFVAPATLNIIPWVEYGIGGYYIKGGIFKLAEALQKLAEKNGAEFNFNSPVTEILTKKRKAIGIKTDSENFSDYVLANSDTVETANKLTDKLPKENLNKLESSLSGMVFLWGVDGVHDKLEHHNIIFTKDYKAEFDSLFNKLEAPEDPTIYISITSKKDSEHSPVNSENWFVLLNMPYLNGQNWEEIKFKMKEKVLKKIKSIGLDIKNKIKKELILTPLDLYNMYGSNKGSIYGISSNDKYSAFLRPRNRSKHLENLYFAGGSSHPGGGVPLASLSGKIASKLIFKKSGKKFSRK